MDEIAANEADSPIVAKTRKTKQKVLFDIEQVSFHHAPVTLSSLTTAVSALSQHRKYRK